MSEIRRVTDMDQDEIHQVLSNLDWTEIHKARVFGDYGSQVVVFTDGDWTLQGQNTYYRDQDAAGVLTYLRMSGEGNIDTTVYLEGWTRPELDEDGIHTGNYIIDYGFDSPDNGTVLTRSEAIEKSIEEGEWDEDEEVYQLLEDIREYVVYRRAEIEEREEERAQNIGEW